MHYFLSIAALLLVTSSATGYMYTATRIDRSEHVSIKQYPYRVSVEHNNGFICSGVILNENWILTVVTCTPVDASNPFAFVRSGSDLKGRGGNVHQIVDIIKHENFKIVEEGVYENEIALIRVKEPFVLDDTRKTIELLKPDDKLNPGTKAKVTSFVWDGYSDDGKRLKVLKKSIVDYKTCNKAYKSEYGVPKKGYICAKYEDDRRRSILEFGDPLVDSNGRLAGLVYRLNDYYRSRVYHPVLYTDIAYYHQWVEKHIEQYSLEVN